MNALKRLLFLVNCLVLNFSVGAQTFDLNSASFSVGERYVVEPKIRFDLAKWTIQEESFKTLNELAAWMLDHEGLVIEVGTHIDVRGSDKMSRRLDKKRSDAIVSYLVSKGVPSSKLEAKGYGKTKPLISSEVIQKLSTAVEQEAAHAKNRRTELLILKAW